MDEEDLLAAGGTDAWERALHASSAALDSPRTSLAPSDSVSPVPSVELINQVAGRRRTGSGSSQATLSRSARRPTPRSISSTSLTPSASASSDVFAPPSFIPVPVSTLATRDPSPNPEAVAASLQSRLDQSLASQSELRRTLLAEQARVEELERELAAARSSAPSHGQADALRESTDRADEAERSRQGFEAELAEERATLADLTSRLVEIEEERTRLEEAAFAAQGELDSGREEVGVVRDALEQSEGERRRAKAATLAALWRGIAQAARAELDAARSEQEMSAALGRVFGVVEERWLGGEA